MTHEWLIENRKYNTRSSNLARGHDIAFPSQTLQRIFTRPQLARPPNSFQSAAKNKHTQQQCQNNLNEWPNEVNLHKNNNGPARNLRETRIFRLSQQPCAKMVSSTKLLTLNEASPRAQIWNTHGNVEITTRQRRYAHRGFDRGLMLGLRDYLCESTAR